MTGYYLDKTNNYLDNVKYLFKDTYGIFPTDVQYVVKDYYFEYETGEISKVQAFDNPIFVCDYSVQKQLESADSITYLHASSSVVSTPNDFMKIFGAKKDKRHIKQDYGIWRCLAVSGTGSGIVKVTITGFECVSSLEKPIIKEYYPKGYWRTPQIAELNYLFMNQNTCWANINSINGVIVFSKDYVEKTSAVYKIPTYTKTYPVNADIEYTANNNTFYYISLENWEVMQSNGARFIPFAGMVASSVSQYTKSDITNYNKRGSCQSSTKESRSWVNHYVTINKYGSTSYNPSYNAFALNSQTNMYVRRAVYLIHDVTATTEHAFMVASNKYVDFAKSALVYDLTEKEFTFHTNAYDTCYDETDKFIDLFAYGTSGYNGYSPIGYSTPQGINIYNTNYDWGVFNAIRKEK